MKSRPPLTIRRGEGDQLSRLSTQPDHVICLRAHAPRAGLRNAADMRPDAALLPPLGSHVRYHALRDLTEALPPQLGEVVVTAHANTFPKFSRPAHVCQDRPSRELSRQTMPGSMSVETEHGANHWTQNGQ